MSGPDRSLIVLQDHRDSITVRIEGRMRAIDHNNS